MKYLFLKMMSKIILYIYIILVVNMVEKKICQKIKDTDAEAIRANI